MSLFSRRRSIKGFFRSFHISFDEPSLLKFVILSAAIASIFYFRFWAEKQGQHLLLPTSGSALLTAAAGPDQPVEGKTPSFGSVDINTASQKELESLPGIGPKLANAIINDRLQNGPIRQADDLLRVKGIGPKRLERMSPYLHFHADK